MSLFGELDELEQLTVETAKVAVGDASDGKSTSAPVTETKAPVETKAPESKVTTQIFFSQNHQDDFVSFYLSEVLKLDIRSMGKNGKFVDVGTSDGRENNNTFHFERFLQWEGLCIDANPDVAKAMPNTRSCKLFNGAAYDSDGKTKFMKIDGYSSSLSGIVSDMQIPHRERIDKEIKIHGGKQTLIDVETAMIQSLMDTLEWKHVNYMSIDTCGSELKVLKGIDFHRTSVDIFTIDMNSGRDTDNMLIFMSERGYSRLLRMGNDDVYIKTGMVDVALRVMTEKGLIKKG